MSFRADLFVTLLLILVVALVIAIVYGIYHHTHKEDFEPKFVRLEDGSLKVEFHGFGGIQKSRTKRFYGQYKVGSLISYEDKQYEILELTEAHHSHLMRIDIKIVAHVREV